MSNPDYDIVYVDEMGVCWTHHGKGEFEKIDIATLELQPVLVVMPGQYYVDGSAKGISGLCRVKGRQILPKPQTLAKWI
jgi:hypothetical protein